MYAPSRNVRIDLPFGLDFLPTDLDMDGDHLLIKKYLLTKLGAF